MQELLESLARLLRQTGDSTLAAMVEGAIAGPVAGIDTFLSSNELWGGAGSIADCAGGGERSERRREIERVLIQLGNEQMRSGNVNPRTEMWVKAFTAWQGADI
jgi:hypothetical protein